MTEEEIITALESMESDISLITVSAYTTNNVLWPDNRIPFTQTHLKYLKNNPKTSPEHYLSNLKLMIRKR